MVKLSSNQGSISRLTLISNKVIIDNVVSPARGSVKQHRRLTIWAHREETFA